MDDLYRGQRIGKYEILTQLSLGGMAELFLAFTSGPGGFRKYVVVKRILPDAKGDEQFVKMFLDEARITAAFSHPNIGQVFDLDEDEEGLYLAMEFISGQNLNQVAAACRRRQRPVPIGFSCTVARETCNALHYAHTFTDPVGRAFPVIHRDVAQKNVMVTYDGVTKLLDFGIAQARGKLGRTNVGMVKGTTGYMSPEQVRGEVLDGRSDVFSVGVMLHELLTGRRLFGAETEIEEMQLILDAPIPKIQELNPLVPDEVAEIVHRALARERADRWPTAREMARALERHAAKLLFDQEQMAALMRELFEDKMAATRALLESAGENDSLLAHAAVRELSKDDGEAFQKAPTHTRPVPESGVPSGGKSAPEHDTDERPASAPPAEHPDARPQKESPWGFVVAVLLAVAIVGAGYGVYAFVVSLPPAPEDVVAAKDLEVKPFVDPRLKVDPGSVGPSGQSPNGVTRPVAGEEDSADEGPTTKKVRRSRKARTGTLTLITIPDSEVSVGNKVVGTTPLFNVSLPEGTHLLKLKGPDGRTYALSAPIKSGEATRFRVKLVDLPPL